MNQAGLLSELRIKLRDEQSATLKSSLLNPSMNEALHVQDASPISRLRRVDELSSAPCERSSSAQLLTRYETSTVFLSASDSGEGGVEKYRIRRSFSIPPSADGLAHTWITGLRQFSV